MSSRLVVALGLALSSTASASNVLLIIGDDIGVDIIPSYGEHSRPATMPTLDTLADNGVTFRNAWAHPTCSPSRASILTGRHAFRHGVLHAGQRLEPSETTLATTLSSAGYATALFGKWHLGTRRSDPVSHGFQYYAGGLNSGVADYFDWEKVTMDATSSTVHQEQTYATIDATLEAYTWIRQQTQPWFAVVAYNAPHAPFQVPPSSLLSPATRATLSGAEGDGCGSGLPDNQRSCYLAMTEAMDTAMGEMVRRLYAQGRLDDTLVIFIGDNGTPAGIIRDDGVFSSSHGKGTVYEGGVNVPLVMLGGPQLGLARGIEETDLVQGLDLFATILEVAGLPNTTGTDSQSLLGYLDGTGEPPRTQLYTELFDGQTMDGQWAVTNGTDKYLYNYGAVECYDLLNDPGESVNLYQVPNGNTAPCDQLAASRPCLNDPSHPCP